MASRQATVSAEDVVRQAPALRLVPDRITSAAIADADRLRSLDGQYDSERSDPVGDRIDGEIDEDDLEWASYVGSTHARAMGEGAGFVRLAQDVFVIPVVGGQMLHDDRHLAEMSTEEAAGFNEHTWNLVVEGSETQMLLCENGHEMFEHFALDRGALIYMNTVNRHMLSRKNPDDVVVIVQVDGFRPEQRDLAVARLRDVLATRPRWTRVS